MFFFSFFTTKSLRLWLQLFATKKSQNFLIILIIV
jgi:hypothetical protein